MLQRLFRRRFRDRRPYLKGLHQFSRLINGFLEKSEDYQKVFLTSDRRNAQIAIGLIWIGMQALSVLDAPFLFPSWAFVKLEVCRSLLVGFACWAIWRFRQVQSYRDLHAYLSSVMPMGLLVLLYLNSLVTGMGARDLRFIEADVVMMIIWYGLAPGSGLVLGFWAIVWMMMDFLSMRLIWTDVRINDWGGYISLLLTVNLLGVSQLYLRSERRKTQLQQQNLAMPNDRTVFEQLEKLAFTDELTGISNRRRILEQLTSWLGQYQLNETLSPPILLLADLDFFKSINDTYGHNTGDLVLQKFSQAVQNLLQTKLQDCFLFGRLGGEEFLVVLRLPNMDEALEVAHLLCEVCRQQQFLSEEGKLIQFTVSIGVSPVSRQDVSITDTISRCDAALYRAKHNGRDRVECEPQ